jgi:hypothetical protein
MSTLSEIFMKQLFEAVVGWLSASAPIAARPVERASAESERRLRELQESGRVQFLP